MREVYIWKVTATVRKNSNYEGHSTSEVVITSKKSFAQAEEVGRKLFKKLGDKRSIEFISIDKIDFINIAFMEEEEGVDYEE